MPLGAPAQLSPFYAGLDGTAMAASIELAGRFLLSVLKLLVEDHTFKLLRKAAELSRAVRRFDALQQGEKRLVRMVHRRGSGLGHRDVLAKLMRATILRLRPAYLNRFACAFAALFRSEFGGSCRTALSPTFAP